MRIEFQYKELGPLFICNLLTWFDLKDRVVGTKYRSYGENSVPYVLVEVGFTNLASPFLDSDPKDFHFLLEHTWVVEYPF